MLIVGLGNFGKAYIGTHHNVGFMVVDKLATKLGIKLSKKACDAKFFEGVLFGEKTVIAQPLTYMNLSGGAVCKLAKKFKIPNEKIIIIYDDIDLAPGKTRFRKNGSGGTHNGMKNVVLEMGEDIPRIRVGIGKAEKVPLFDFVLSKMKGEEKVQIINGMDRVVDVLLEFLENKNELILEELNK